MPRNGVSSAAPSRAPPRPAGRSRGSASRPTSISSHRAHGASQTSPSASRSPFAKPKGGTVSEPEEASSPRATSSRNGGRDPYVSVGVKSISRIGYEEDLYTFSVAGSKASIEDDLNKNI